MLSFKKYTLLVFIIVFSNTSYAQSKIFNLLFPPIDSVITRYDTSLVDPKLDQLTLRLYSGYTGNELLLENADETAVYSANSKYKLGLGFGYRWLILNGAFVAPFSNKYNTDRGKTFSFDAQINIYAPRIQTDLRAQWIDGYYQKTHDDIYSNYRNEGPFILREDMRLRALGAGVTYTFNRNYLHKHGFDQTKTMKRSGGTLFCGVRTNYMKVFTDSVLLVDSNSDSIQELTSFGGGVSFGGAYTFLLGDHLFFSIHGALNATVNYVETKSLPTISKESGDQYNFSFSPTIRSAFGYNSEHHFIGMYSVIDNVLNNAIDGRKIDYFFTSIKLIYAYRLKVK